MLRTVRQDASHSNIVRLLFAFQEYGESDDRSGDGPVTSISLVFQYHEYDLAKILRNREYQDKFRHFPNAALPPIEHKHVLEHGIWRGMMDIVSTVIKLHSLTSTTWIGHFDIKPANILIEVVHGSPENTKLLLADFGSAVEGREGENETTGVDINAVTTEYAPPEQDDSFTGRRIHDKWSLGCILLELIVMLTGLENEAINFYNARLTETDSGAFWCHNKKINKPTLCRSVEDRLEAFARHEELQPTIECIRRMLDVTETTRKECNLTDCLRVFTPLDTSWLDPKDKKIKDCRLRHTYEDGNIELFIEVSSRQIEQTCKCVCCISVL